MTLFDIRGRFRLLDMYPFIRFLSRDGLLRRIRVSLLPRGEGLVRRDYCDILRVSDFLGFDACRDDAFFDPNGSFSYNSSRRG